MIWGRLIGTLIGFKVLGLFGGMVGYIVGGWFDRSVRIQINQQWFKSQEYKTYTYNDPNYQRQEEFFTQSPVQDAYRVLGVASTATIPDIKQAYRRLMSQHHPDKLASRELPEGMLRMAKEKTQQIRSAYDLIRKQRGF